MKVTEEYCIAEPQSKKRTDAIITVLVQVSMLKTNIFVQFWVEERRRNYKLVHRLSESKHEKCSQHVKRILMMMIFAEQHAQSKYIMKLEKVRFEDISLFCFCFSLLSPQSHPSLLRFEWMEILMKTPHCPMVKSRRWCQTDMCIWLLLVINYWNRMDEKWKSSCHIVAQCTFCRF